MNVRDIVIEGTGAPIVLIHGWPDTLRLWDRQVEALKDRYRCIRFTLPGFDRADGGRAFSLDEVIDAIRDVVEKSAPGEKVTLLLHDWGCFFGYQFAMRHPQLVSRVIGVDIGDAGSRQHLEEIGVAAQLGIVLYQVWLSLAWKWRSDAMARFMARRLRAPADPRTVHAGMGYAYALRWLGAAGGLHGLRAFRPEVPMLYLYGERKPFMFHSRAWAEALAARPGCRVTGFDTGHWIMVSRTREFNEAVLSWLA